MSTGDATDFAARLRSVLPARWFPDVAPVLDSVLGGLASAWASGYGLLEYTRAQARIATASGVFLDLIAADYFGLTIARSLNESDIQFRARILRELLRPRGTRAALIAALTDLTGRAPIVFEPARPADTGAYGGPTLAYGSAAPGVAVDYRPSSATYFDGSGVLHEVAANVIRPAYVGGVQTGYLNEPAATNTVRNPRWEGAVAGTPGTLPTYSSVSLGAGLSRQVVGTGTYQGAAYIDLRVFGTSTGDGLALNFYADGGTTPVTAGNTWTASIIAQLVAGTLPGVFGVYIGEYGGGSLFPGTAVASPAAWARTSETATIPAGHTSAQGMVWVYCTSGQVVDFTVRLAVPQFELGATATTPILPPAGAPAATTRAADTIWTPDGGHGGYGSLLLPFQCFVNAYRPHGGGIASVGGYYAGSGWAGGGYGVGALEYASTDMISGQVTDADIYDAVARTMPAATIAWTNIAA